MLWDRVQRPESLLAWVQKSAEPVLLRAYFLQVLSEGVSAWARPGATFPNQRSATSPCVSQELPGGKKTAVYLMHLCFLKHGQLFYQKPPRISFG